MILSAIVLWLYTAYRAAHLSMTHDESHTFLSFLQQPVWPCFFSPICWETANNHLLNTWLMQLSVHWFGISEFFIRLPNVLSHGLYILFSILLVRSLNYSFWPALAVFALLNFNPYLLDFFSLARGYGLSAALFIGAIYFLQRYALAIGSPWQNLFSLYACGWLSIMSNFTALNFMFCVFGVQLLLAIYFLLKGRYTKNQILIHTVFPLVFALSLFMLLKLPIQILKEKGEFLYGASSAWDTLVILARDILYGQNYLGGKTEFILLVTVISSIIFTLYFLVRTFNKLIPISVWITSVFLIGIGAFLLMIIQHYFLQSSYLFNRKAILFIPPFALMLGSAFAFLQDRTKNLVSITVLLVLTWHLGRTMNTSFCREWWYDANTKTVMLELERISQQNSDTITLGTNWLFMPTAEFYRVTRQMSRIAPLVYDKAIQADGRFDYYYIDYPDWPLLQNNYQKIMEFASGSRMLVRKK